MVKFKSKSIELSLRGNFCWYYWRLTGQTQNTHSNSRPNYFWDKPRQYFAWECVRNNNWEI